MDLQLAGRLDPPDYGRADRSGRLQFGDQRGAPVGGNTQQQSARCLSIHQHAGERFVHVLIDAQLATEVGLGGLVRAGQNALFPELSGNFVVFWACVVIIANSFQIFQALRLLSMNTAKERGKLIC